MRHASKMDESDLSIKSATNALHSAANVNVKEASSSSSSIPTTLEGVAASRFEAAAGG